MLYWTVVFLVMALVAAVLGSTGIYLVIALVAAVVGFTGIYLAATGIAKVLFLIFLLLFVLSLLAGIFYRAPA